MQALSYTGDLTGWQRLARDAVADVGGRLDPLRLWAPRRGYVLSVTVLLL
jgi:hypothetical protein